MSENESAASGRRLSLTKSQLQTADGAGLLKVCETVTEAGIVSQAGLNDLSQWLRSHSGSALPAAASIKRTVERMPAEATPEELRDLYCEIEKVLPPEAREKAKERRRTAEEKAKQHRRSERESERVHQAEERQRNRILASANFMVAGVRYEGRGAVIARYAGTGERVFLVRARGNEFSGNALEIRLANGMQIGFVPENDAIRLAPLFDAGCRHIAAITKILDQARCLIPVVDVSVYGTTATVEGIVAEDEVPAKAATAQYRDPDAQTSGFNVAALLLWLMVFAGIVVALAILRQ